jgi:hypothetical protein
MAVVLPVGFYITHRVMISLKYATLTESEYKKFMSCEDDALGLDYAMQLQLLSGLLGLHPAVLNFEIAAAATRMAIKRFSEHCVLIDCRESRVAAGAGREDWSRFIKEALGAVDVSDVNLEQEQDSSSAGRRSIVRELQLSKSGSEAPLPSDLANTTPAGGVEEVPISVVIAALIHRASRAANPLAQTFIGICAAGLVVIAACPLIKAAEGPPLPATSVVFYVCTTVLLVVFYALTVLFLVTAIFSMNRQWALATELRDMVDLTAASILEAEHAGASPRELEHLEHIAREQSRFITPRGSFGAPAAATGAEIHTDADVDVDVGAVSDWAPHVESEQNNIGARARSPGGEFIHRPPLLVLDSIENVVSFMYIRLILRDYGLRFQFRLDAYVGTLMQFTVVLMLYVVIKLSVSPQSTNFLADMLLVQILALIAVGSIFIFILVLLGARVNHLYIMHKTQLMPHVLQGEKRIAELLHERARVVRGESGPGALALAEVDIEISRQQQLLHALGSAAGMMQTSFNLQPLTVLKIAATYPLAYSIFSAAFSFAIFVFSTFPGSDPAAS